MKPPLETVLEDLTWLVASDTRNPPRDITPDAPIFADLRRRLSGFDVTVHDFGEGCLAFYAVRGRPRTLFNVHLDTVPAAAGWSRDPFTLEQASDRATGLGACDIKGAAACLMAAADVTDAPAAFLFTTDEENGDSRAVRGFLAAEGLDPYDRVVVGEPTQARPVDAHRGIFAAEARFKGVSAHASQGGRSAIHAAGRWLVGALEKDWAGPSRLNFGRIEGGVKPNMVAAECAVRFGFRCAPGEAIAPKRAELEADAGDDLEGLTVRFEGPALPNGGDGAEARQAEVRAWAEGLKLRAADPVDFWTEAALFAAAGTPALVLGPGDIAQAHVADEWVTYGDLSAAFEAYAAMLNNV